MRATETRTSQCFLINVFLTLVQRVKPQGFVCFSLIKAQRSNPGLISAEC